MSRKLEYEDLLQYIKTATELERSLYEQDMLYRKLSYQIDMLKKGNPKPYLKYQNSYVRSGYSVALGCGSAICIGIVAFMVKGFFFAGIFFNGIISSLMLLVIAFFLFGFFPGYISNKIKERKMNKYNDEIAERNKQIEYENQQKKVYDKQQIDIINKERDKVYQLYCNTRNALRELYALDVVYIKYQGLVPICTIYEYLYSQRCYQLEGHGGAYDTYEVEIRQNVIIGKLDTVIQKLDAIIENQRMLHQEISRSNQIASEMSKKICSAAAQLSTLSQNAEVSAYYNKITAQNTEYLKWSDFMKTNLLSQ